MSTQPSNSPKPSSAANADGDVVLMSRARPWRASSSASCEWKFRACEYAASRSNSTFPTMAQPARWKPSEMPPQPENRSSTRGWPPPAKRASLRCTAWLATASGVGDRREVVADFGCALTMHES